ncbi:MAG TPA: OmpA family protein [Usitatibacter sp.]|nr:OmpA family protein [Usitatibacter sp.]
MVGSRRLLGLVLLGGFCAVAGAEDQPAKVLDIERQVLDIEGLSLGLEGALQDLGAKVVGQEIVIELSADVLFDFDKADLKPAAKGTLAKVAEVLKGMPNSPASVDGHTDGKGNADYNQKLSERRASSVRDWLVKQGGVPASRLTARGFGMTRPIAPNARTDGSDDPEGRQKNRRVEIRVTKRG